MRVIYTLLLVVTSSCSRVPLRTEVGTSIMELISMGDSTVIDLPALTNFDWDEVCLLGASLRPVDISSALGFEWKGKRAGARGSFIFVDTRHPRSDSVATGHLPIQRNQWMVEASGCIPRSQAKFVVRLAAGSPPALVPIAAGGSSPKLTPF